MARFVTAGEAAALIRDGDAVALLGNGGGVLEPKAVHKAIEESFLATGMPRQLTLYHSAGIGNRRVNIDHDRRRLLNRRIRAFQRASQHSRLPVDRASRSDVDARNSTIDRRAKGCG